MSFTVSIAFYLVIGVAVAVAHTLGERSSWFGALAAWLFWPLYLPLILSRPAVPGSPPASSAAAPPDDELTIAIEQVERELDAALAGLDGWAEHVLVQKAERLRELRGALAAQVSRIRDMEALLAREASAIQDDPVPAFGPHAAGNDRWQKSRLARQENMARIERLCRQAHADLLATLAWIRELVSMIHLARFTGAPAARAEELVAQIAVAVEGISSLNEPLHEPFNEPSLVSEALDDSLSPHARSGVRHAP